MTDQTAQAAVLPNENPNTSWAIREFIRLMGLPSILLILVMYFSITTDTFLTAQNISGLLQSAAISSILFLGLTWVFTVGEMEVSFVAIAALANMICAGMVIAGFGWPVATVCAIGASLCVGFLNGVLIAKLGLPSLVITIATGGMASALAAAIGLGSSLPITEPSYLQFLFDTQVGMVSLIVVLAAVLIAAAWFVEMRLAFGHYIFAMATNQRAVLEAGVPVTGIVILLCLVSAFGNGFAGVLLAVELSSGQPSIAQSLFLDGLTAVLLGGTMIKLGKPNVLGTVVGVLIIAVLVRGGALLGWNDSTFQVIKGGLLLLGVSVVAWSNRKA